LRILTFGSDFQIKDKTGVWTLGQDFAFGFPLHGDGFPLTSRQAETQFFTYGLSLQRLQKLPFNLRGIARIKGQLTDNRLTPQEQLFFGGATTIRGYPESDFLADQGLITNIELWSPFFIVPKSWKLPYSERPLRDQIQLVAFLDHGYGRINDPSGTERHTRNMLAAGGGFEIRFRENISGRVEWGVPLADRPITESGRSQFHFRISTDV